jgi:phospholipase C
MLLAALTACGGGSTLGAPATNPGAVGKKTSPPIQHIVLMVQENRSFNSLFATFPGVTGVTTGMEKIGSGTTAHDQNITLSQVNLEDKQNLNHLYVSYKTAYDGGKMDAFNQIIFQNNGKPEGAKPYQYVNPAQIAPYWTMAKSYAIANNMFQTQGSGSFTAHQDLIRGGTELTPKESLIDDPSSSAAWGCDSPAHTLTNLITTALVYKHLKGPFPCTTHFPKHGVNYTTLETTLDAASISWKYYVPALVDNQPGALWNAFDVIAGVRYGTEWTSNISSPEKNIFTDITNGTLPAMSWVIPDGINSDHPGYASDKGPSWVASVVNAIGQSSYWNSTVIIVVWDDWGGFYDPVAPATIDNQGGMGFRVPMIVISPYTAFNTSGKSPYISQTVYGFGSIIRYVEDTFGLPSLGTTDATSNSMGDMLNYKQSPRQFQPITSSYSRSYFLHQKPSGLPVDTE